MNASRSNRLRPSLQQALEQAKGQIQFEQELCRTISYPSDFNRSDIQEWADLVRKQNAAYRDRSNEQILAQRTLGRIIEGRFLPNYACVDDRLEIVSPWWWCEGLLFSCLFQHFFIIASANER